MEFSKCQHRIGRTALSIELMHPAKKHRLLMQQHTTGQGEHDKQGKTHMRRKSAHSTTTAHSVHQNWASADGSTGWARCWLQQGCCGAESTATSL
jgi:hypothetical protein